MSLDSKSERNEKMQYIASHYGIDKQLSKTQEECAELIQAISKFQLATCSEDHFNGMTKITEEMADVLIMLNQIKFLTNNGIGLQCMIDRKLDRQIQRIADEMSGETKA